jgi:hypothetical protein
MKVSDENATMAYYEPLHTQLQILRAIRRGFSTFWLDLFGIADVCVFQQLMLQLCRTL